MKNVLILVAMSAIASEKVRKDGKVSRQFYTAEFSDPSNPFAKTVKRNFFQDHSADGKTAAWRGGNPETVKKFLNKEIPGSIVSKSVETYKVNEGQEDEREAKSFTTVILGNENEKSVFNTLGHPIVDATVVAVPAKSAQVLAD